ncbi:MAG: STAS domain-containing protein [Ruminiclostridium sp.]|nr:STAS domain-containing protein [Ruminiclostridium sp.]
MNIIKTQNGENLTVKVEGRLDTVTAPQLDSELKASIEGIKTLTLDFSALEYISSAGLRVLLSMQKLMNKQGEMIVKGSSAAILEIFEVTGFIDLLNIE